jgi:phage major head subunit gpT-like protein
MPDTTSSTPADQRPSALPLQMREARIEPSTFNADRNSVEVVWTTGARVRRYDWESGRVYEEELVVSPETVDMSRFEARSVQVLDAHRTYGGVDAILGIAERGWLADGQGIAEIRLTQRPDRAGIVQDIRAGIIRDISFGYSVQRYEIVRAQDRTDGVNADLWRAVRWQPQEISFVPVNADMGASSRSAPDAGSARFPITFIRAGGSPATQPQEHQMPAAQTAAASGLPADPAAGGAGAPAHTQEPQSRAAPSGAQAGGPAAGGAAMVVDVAQRAREEEQIRAADITSLCERAGLAGLASQLIRSGSTLQQAQDQVINQLARNDAASGGHQNVRGIQTVRDEQETLLRGYEEVLMHRVNPREKITDNGRRFRSMSLLQMGVDYLLARGLDVRDRPRMEQAGAMLHFRSGMGGLHTTSDFANLLANVATKRLRMGYDENPGTYRQWARRAPNLPDFKEVTVAQLGAMPDLLRVNEAGEFKYGTFGDGGERYQLISYGRIVPLNRQAIVNDDLRGFDRIVSGFGGAASRLENRLVYAQLTSNPTMSDTVALFAADHGNNGTGGGSALQLSALTAMRTAMRVQKGLASEELNLMPAFLIVPAALEQLAYQLTSSNFVPAQPSNVNEFRTGGRTALEPIVEPVLDASSAATWYAAASNSQVDTVEFAYLDGGEGPVIETEVGFDVDGVSFKCREDFAAKALDWRGLYRGVGS